MERAALFICVRRRYLYRPARAPQRTRSHGSTRSISRKRDGWRAAGDEEKYRQACALVQALTEELEKREFAARGRASG